jgi:hypothetical protein
MKHVKGFLRRVGAAGGKEMGEDTARGHMKMLGEISLQKAYFLNGTPLIVERA